MTIKQFIEKAIEGRWLSDRFPNLEWQGIAEVTVDVNGSHIKADFTRKDGIRDWMKRELSAIVLDPKAWEAVGDVEGWGEICVECHNSRGNCCEKKYPNAKMRMHQMLDALWEDKTIEEFIKTL